MSSVTGSSANRYEVHFTDCDTFTVTFCGLYLYIKNPVYNLLTYSGTVTDSSEKEMKEQ